MSGIINDTLIVYNDSHKYLNTLSIYQFIIYIVPIDEKGIDSRRTFGFKEIWSQGRINPQ